MKRYTVPPGRVADYPHPAPDRTARRAGRSWDSEDQFQVFTNRAAMLKACEISERGAALGSNPWRPFVTEGRTA